MKWNNNKVLKCIHYNNALKKIFVHFVKALIWRIRSVKTTQLKHVVAQGHLYVLAWQKRHPVDGISINLHPGLDTVH